LQIIIINDCLARYSHQSLEEVDSTEAELPMEPLSSRVADLTQAEIEQEKLNILGRNRAKRHRKRNHLRQNIIFKNWLFIYVLQLQTKRKANLLNFFINKCKQLTQLLFKF